MAATRHSYPLALLLPLLLATACGDDGGGDDGGGVEFDAAPGVDADLSPDAGQEPDAGAAAEPVSNVQSSYAGPCDQVSLSWQSPAEDGRNGAVVVRQVGAPVTDTLESGTTYAVNDQLPNGGTVVFFGDATNIVDSGNFLHQDEVHYAVFSRINMDQYGPGIATSVVVDQSLGSQMGSLSIDLSTNEVTPTSPTHFPMTATAVFDGNEGTLNVELTTTNGACRAVHNAKVLANAVNDIEATITGDIEFAGTPALYAGVGGGADGAAFTSTFQLANVSGAVDPIEINVSVIDHPTLTVGAGFGGSILLADSSGAAPAEAVDASSLHFGGESGQLNTGPISPDGELLYTGHGQQPTVVVVDLVEKTAVGSADLTGAANIQNDQSGSIGHVSSVAMSVDYRFLYAVLITGQHDNYACGDPNTPNCNINGRIDRNALDSTIELVRLDRETLAEVDRLTLLSNVTTAARPGELSLSADGTRAALPIRREGKVFLLDLENMAIVDADAGTAGAQAFDLSGRSTEPHLAALAPDASEIFVAYRGSGRGGPSHDESLDRIDTSNGSVTSFAVTTSSGTTDNKSGALLFGPDGRLYYGRKDGSVALSIFDLAANSEVERLPIEVINALAFSSDGSQLFVWDETAVQRFDPSNDLQLSFEATETNLFFVDTGSHHGALTPL